MTRKEMTNERAQSDVRINSAERGGIGRSQIESLFKTHYTQMYHLALTLLFDEAESKDVVSDVFASLLSGRVVMRADNAKAFLLASVHHRCLNVLQHKQVQERFARLLTEDTDTLVSDNTAEEQMQMSPKSPTKNPCLSGFQVGLPLGNVKTAEVRKRGNTSNTSNT